MQCQAIMLNCKVDRHFFPLTSLQIGDMQSYLSRLTLFLAPESKKLFVLVDNRPWLIDQDTRPTHLWQLMVTKSRLSPFANTRARRKGKHAKSGLNFSRIFKYNGGNLRKCVDLTESFGPNAIKFKSISQLYTSINTISYKKKVLLPVRKLRHSFLLNKELHRTLYGFIVFEVAWDHVRGINYLNELQTDTSMALEAKLMKRWEFDSIEQASRSISLWFSGTCYECLLLEEYLEHAFRGDSFYDANEDIIAPEDSRESMANENEMCKDNEIHEEKLPCVGSGSSFFSHDGMEEEGGFSCTLPPASGPYKRRRITRSSSVRYGVQEDPDGVYPELRNSQTSSESSISSHETDTENVTLVFEATNYKDVLFLFKSDDHDLPFKLRQIIMLDLRLLTLLEYGLPSWVIFLQSYPVFCKIYRPWMCPLARGLYVLMSIITVLIGFYDLYKNVPLLKTTASRLFGPFFGWIENWEMVSRIKYLGTMLFLHNFEKAVKWFLMIARVIKSLLAVLTKPFTGPAMELVEFIVPFWNMLLEVMEGACSVLWFTIETIYIVVTNITQIIVWPFYFLFSIMWNLATLVLYPVLWVLCEILIAPARLLLGLASLATTAILQAYYVLREFWSFLSVMFQFASNSEAVIVGYEPSLWRSLWNDLFSQIFRAVRSILYGFVAFFATCNRHRLSIYNHMRKIFLRLSCGHNTPSNGSLDVQRRQRAQKSLEGVAVWEKEYIKELPERARRRRRRKGSSSGTDDVSNVNAGVDSP